MSSNELEEGTEIIVIDESTILAQLEGEVYKLFERKVTNND